MSKTLPELRIDHAKRQIIMSRTFAKKQSNIDSQEYDKLQKIHLNFPEYVIVQKTITKTPKNTYTGLTYERMEKYIQAHDITGDTMKEYLELRELSKCHSGKYPIIKKWFLIRFPEVKNYGNFEEISA